MQAEEKPREGFGDCERGESAWVISLRLKGGGLSWERGGGWMGGRVRT